MKIVMRPLTEEEAACTRMLFEAYITAEYAEYRKQPEALKEVAEQMVQFWSQITYDQRKEVWDEWRAALRLQPRSNSSPPWTWTLEK